MRINLQLVPVLIQMVAIIANSPKTQNWSGCLKWKPQHHQTYQTSSKAACFNKHPPNTNLEMNLSTNQPIERESSSTATKKESLVSLSECQPLAKSTNI